LQLSKIFAIKLYNHDETCYQIATGNTVQMHLKTRLDWVGLASTHHNCSQIKSTSQITSSKKLITITPIRQDKHVWQAAKL